MSLNEAIIQDAALGWFAELGDAVGHGQAVSIPAINQHLMRLFSDNELEQGAVVKRYLIAAAPGVAK